MGNGKRVRIEIPGREEQPGPPRRFAALAVKGAGYALHIDLRPCNVCTRSAECKKFRPARKEL